MKTLVSALAAMTIGAVAMTAHATVPVRVMVQEPVSYHDLNLETELGADTLLTRIQVAARKVCIRANPDLMKPNIRDLRYSCTEAATARAVASINAPLLTRRAISLGVIDAAGGVARASLAGVSSTHSPGREARVRLSTCTVLLALSCAADPADRPYTPPRLDNGQPDMQGVWIASNATPLQRPPGFTTLVIDEAQAAKLLAALNARAEDRSTPTEPTEYFDPPGIEPIRGQLRSSLIIDPPDGQIPGNDLYEQHFAQAVKDALIARDGPEQRPAPERCLGSQTTAPPIMSIRSGVNLHQIVQTADSFVFTSEFVNTARIVRLNARRVPAHVTSWLGDPIGRWEGDTLVVETRGFTPSDHFRGGLAGSFLVTPRTVVTERFVRAAEDRIDYTFTVEDPTYYTQPWTGESHFMRRDEQVLEYACHEANYSLIHILEGAREQERRAQH